jgi:hypothetical protein
VRVEFKSEAVVHFDQHKAAFASASVDNYGSTDTVAINTLTVFDFFYAHPLFLAPLLGEASYTTKSRVSNPTKSRVADRRWRINHTRQKSAHGRSHFRNTAIAYGRQRDLNNSLDEKFWDWRTLLGSPQPLPLVRVADDED